MKKLFLLSLLIFSLALLQGCYTSSDKHTLFNSDKSEAYQLEEVKSVHLFAPTYQYQRAKACEVKATLIKSNSYSSGYTKYEAVNCKVMTTAGGWNKDLGTPTGPSLLQAGGGMGGAAIIADGIRDSEDNINNTNSQNQGQAQQQGQLQGQGQKSYNSNRNYNYNRNHNSNVNRNRGRY